VPDEILTDHVRSETTFQPGRSLNSARSNHFVIDSSSGSPEAITSIEAFLSGISSCGANIVHREAVTRGMPLMRATVDIESHRAKADTTTLTGVDMRFELFGVTQAQAEELVDAYTRR
jgi:uncharacterized OsmC-like protein